MVKAGAWGRISARQERPGPSNTSPSRCAIRASGWRKESPSRSRIFAGIRDGDRCDFRRDEAPGRGAQRRQFYRANAGHAGTVARLREGQAAIVREDTRIVDADV